MKGRSRHGSFSRETGYETGLREGQKRGMQEGLEKGLKEGSQRAKHEAMQKLLGEGVAPETVAKVFDISLDELISLNDKLSADE
jgi:predicted transposase/invertase (TIGR01784 family)